jgi:K+-sensing histidine kinase KdpD
MDAAPSILFSNAPDGKLAFTNRKAREYVGLAISRSIIEEHDGQLWAENNPEYGAKFSVKLPVADERCATSACR